MQKEILVCDCNWPNHQIIIMEDEGKVCFLIHLCPYGFWKRLWVGLGYIFFNKRAKYGYWQEFIFNPEDKEKLIKYLENETINKQTT